MAITLDGTLGITTPTYGGATSAEYSIPVTGFKNRIINGAMVIDQRNAGASVTPNNSYTLDRWSSGNSQTGKFSVQQNAGAVTPPTGFFNYLGCTSLSAYSVPSNEYFLLIHKIEGFNIADLGWGTANAQAITLSFKVYSSLTGTFGGVVQNSANTRTYPFTYSIPVANTWTTNSITIAGDTTGTWVINNGVGIQLNFGLGVGSTFSGTAGSWAGTQYLSATGAVSVVGTSGATFYITGVQLEKGSTATSFDYRPYGTELSLCQRYLPAIIASNNQYLGAAANTTTSYVFISIPTTARVSPTGITIPALSNFTLFNASASSGTPTSLTFDSAGTQSAMCIVNTTAASPTLVAGQVDFLRISNANGYILFTGCEL